MRKNISGQFAEDAVFPVIRVMPVMDRNTQVFCTDITTGLIVIAETQSAVIIRI